MPFCLGEEQLTMHQFAGNASQSTDNGDEVKDSSSLLNPILKIAKNIRKEKGFFNMHEIKTPTTDGYDSEEEYMRSKSNSDEKICIDEKTAAADLASYSRVSASLIFFFPALGGLLFGYDIGATSAVLSQIKSATSGVQWSSNVIDNSSLQGIITSMATLGALVGSLVCFRVADSWGRRKSLLVASSLYICGAVFEVVSGQSTFSATTGISLLLFGRLVYGFGIGFAMNGAPAYIGEMAPSAIRGKQKQNREKQNINVV